MRQGRPARTAQTVAFARAIESQRPREERLFEDPFRLGTSDAETLEVNCRSVRMLRTPGGREYWRRFDYSDSPEFREFVESEFGELPER